MLRSDTQKTDLGPERSKYLKDTKVAFGKSIDMKAREYERSRQKIGVRIIVSTKPNIFWKDSGSPEVLKRKPSNETMLDRSNPEKQQAGAPTTKQNVSEDIF